MMTRLAGVAMAALICAVTVEAAATPAMAAATVTQQTITTVIDPIPIPSDSCHPGATGVLTGTGTVRSVTVQVGDQFHVSGTVTGPGRIDWSDGSYSIISSTDHFAFNAGTGTAVYADAHVDSADNYSADGVLESQGLFRSVEHFTITNGVIERVAFERGHVQGAFC
jgi:hypothetical protein